MRALTTLLSRAAPLSHHARAFSTTRLVSEGVKYRPNYASRPPDPRTYYPEDPDRFVKGPYDPRNPMGDWATRDPKQNHAGPGNAEEADPQLFGYPQIAPEYAQYRNPRAGWWDKHERRNFGEFVPEFQDTAVIQSVEQRPYINGRGGWYFLIVLFGSQWLLFQWSKFSYTYPIAVEREYPYNGLFNAQAGQDPQLRFPVYRGIEDEDKFHGSQREYYLGRRQDGSL